MNSRSDYKEIRCCLREMRTYIKQLNFVYCSSIFLTGIGIGVAVYLFLCGQITESFIMFLMAGLLVLAKRYADYTIKSNGKACSLKLGELVKESVETYTAEFTVLLWEATVRIDSLIFSMKIDNFILVLFNLGYGFSVLSSEATVIEMLISLLMIISVNLLRFHSRSLNHKELEKAKKFVAKSVFVLEVSDNARNYYLSRYKK